MTVADYQTIALWLGGVVMTLLSFLGLNLWTDVKAIKERWITREEFNKRIEISDAERDKKHVENTENFRRLGQRLETADERHFASALKIEERLGEIAARVAALRPHRPDGGPERRNGY